MREGVLCRVGVLMYGRRCQIYAEGGCVCVRGCI